jgi:hypothetical protein
VEAAGIVIAVVDGKVQLPLGVVVAFMPGLAAVVNTLLPIRNASVDEGLLSGIFNVVVVFIVAAEAVSELCIRRTGRVFLSFVLASKLNEYVVTAMALKPDMPAAADAFIFTV